MNKIFGIIIIVVILFVGFLLGYSIPPFIHAGVFSDREEKGVEVVIDEETEKYYDNLFKDNDEEDE
ncbi:MAG TPA: hypothetical protein ENG83_10680 [Nitrospirae bacterium]|nr:hypothetical protein BMS3Abin06_00240 [bacterium BMS3Abin06]HDH12637.1 hypothetical protein [Nitrospirota bacterium]HDZ02669.1 hypothetical protein [Nitrospirota bacterium]